MSYHHFLPNTDNTVGVLSLGDYKQSFLCQYVLVNSVVKSKVSLKYASDVPRHKVFIYNSYCSVLYFVSGLTAISAFLELFLGLF